MLVGDYVGYCLDYWYVACWRILRGLFCLLVIAWVGVYWIWFWWICLIDFIGYCSLSGFFCCCAWLVCCCDGWLIDLWWVGVIVLFACLKLDLSVWNYYYWDLYVCLFWFSECLWLFVIVQIEGLFPDCLLNYSLYLGLLWWLCLAFAELMFLFCYVLEGFGFCQLVVIFGCWLDH